MIYSCMNGGSERGRERRREKERGVMGADARDTSERAGERERDSVIAAEAEAGGDAERTRQTEKERERERSYRSGRREKTGARE